MPIEGDYARSTFDFAADQAEQYERTDGREANELMGRPVIILTTRGRRSGKVRKTPLMRVEHDGDYAAIASMGGAPKHPVWYLNLLADPRVMLQDGPVRRDYRARVVDGDERDTWWARANETWPDYDGYQAKTERVIPVVVLEPVDAAG